MSSPAEIPILSIIKLDRLVDTTIYLQIANQLSNAIQRGILPSGIKLPGSRTLSKTLEVHRQTIVSAYAELEAQGWVETRPNQGTYVLSNEKVNSAQLSKKNKQYLLKYPDKTGFEFKKSNLFDNPFEFEPCDLLLDDGAPDIRLTHIHQLSSFYTSNLKRKVNLNKLNHYNTEGSEYFKEQLANYLNYSRGLHITSNNLLITRSTEMSVYIASEVLLNPKDIVIVGSLSYFAVNMIFQKSGAAIRTVPIDEQGIDTESIKKICEQQRIRMVYITPHHHYPTTVTLSAQRRLELLALSEKYGFIILEDDYDYEFRYDRAPILPMVSADTVGMVVYIGSFGKSLAPGFRTGFIVAPENLMQEMRKHLGLIDRQGDIMMEQALGEMIEEGEIHRYLKKSLKIYEQRRNHCAILLQKHLYNYLDFDIPNGGLAIWTRWNPQISLYQLTQKCKKKGVFIPKNLLYQTKEVSGLRLGFGRFSEDEMEKILETITSTLATM